MKERPSHEIERDPCWTTDIGLSEGRFRYTRNEPVIVRARIHQAQSVKSSRRRKPASNES